MMETEAYYLLGYNAVPEDSTLHNHCCENLKSYMLETFPTHLHSEGFLRKVNSKYVGYCRFLIKLNL
jgi:hypothetical protein